MQQKLRITVSTATFGDVGCNRGCGAPNLGFIGKYEDRIHGVLSCFDRMLFRGYLPIMSGWQMARFFNSQNIRFRVLKSFLVEGAQRVKLA